MVEDGEIKKVKDLNDFMKDVSKLQKDLNSLKRKVTKLSDTVFVLDNLGLQQQIFNQNDEIKKLRESVLITKRWLAKFEMNFNQSHLCTAIDNKLYDPTRETLKQKIKMEYASMSTSLITSNEPLTLSGKFLDECVKISKQYKLNAYG